MRRKHPQPTTEQNVRSLYWRRNADRMGAPYIRSLIPEMLKETRIALYEVSVHSGVPYQTLHRASRKHYPTVLENTTVSNLIWFFSEFFQRPIGVDDLLIFVPAEEKEQFRAGQKFVTHPTILSHPYGGSWQSDAGSRGHLALRSNLPALIEESGLPRLEIAMRSGLPYQTVSRLNAVDYPIRLQTGTIESLCAFFTTLFHRDMKVSDLLVLEVREVEHDEGK